MAPVLSFQSQKMIDGCDPDTMFLEMLGRSVRVAREQCPMSRKKLAESSRISERYIAQLESGKGNISIALLRRVAAAIGTHLEDLIPSADRMPDWLLMRELVRKATPEQIAQAMDVLRGAATRTTPNAQFAGIALIGLPGAGKTTLGRILAKRIRWDFVELNGEIERQNGLSVAEIVELYGHERLRRLERAALTQVLSQNGPLVLATGSSIVTEENTFNSILASFYTIWLKAKPEEYLARVRRQIHWRPGASDEAAIEALRDILVSRNPLYAVAPAVLDTAGISVDTAAARLIDTVSLIVRREPSVFRPSDLDLGSRS